MAGPQCTVSPIRYDLAAYGLVTEVINATTFRAVGLIGQEDGAFVDYNVYALAKADRTTTPPRGEQQPCVAYVSSTGQITHTPFTAPLVRGDAVLLLHPSLDVKAETAIVMGWQTYPGTTTANWEVAEAVVCTIGGIGMINKIHSLCLDINAMQGIVTVRFYTDINGVNRQVYIQTFTVAADGPGLYMVNGTLALSGMFTVTAQSNNVLDNAQAIGWEYILGGV